MRIIISGAGAVGTHLAKLLSRENMEICLMDESRERLGQLDANYDLLTKQGSPTSLEDLRDLGVKDVDLYIAVTPNEAVNITSCLIANALGAKRTLARIDNYEYIQPENKGLFENLGLKAAADVHSYGFYTHVQSPWPASPSCHIGHSPRGTHNGPAGLLPVLIGGF